MENSKDNNNFCRNVVLSLKTCKEMILWHKFLAIFRRSSKPKVFSSLNRYVLFAINGVKILAFLQKSSCLNVLFSWSY